MKIAQIAPIIERVPPKKYGGTERVVHALTEELVRRGHEVTLFASGDSETTAELFSVYPRALREARLTDLYGMNVYTTMNIGVAYERQHEFDIIHDHNGYASLPAANMSDTPVVMTYHGPFSPEVRTVFQTLRKPNVVTISWAQAKYAPNINHAGTVYNGLDMDAYPFSATHEGYLLFVGRISEEKGVHNAIHAAQYLNLPLIIAAKLDQADLQYFNNHIKPFLSDEIRWIGEVDVAERNALMSKAMVMLHPVGWPEPFGLTMIEAMACGSPVIAFNRGSIPEVVKDGETGFVVNDVEEMIDAIGRLNEIDRAKCREYALTNFNHRKMTDGYLEIYERLIAEKKNGEAK
ncbi:MAG TPA: glycosyltransferase family 4 protein [Candidatus Paceibacterota bacterium]|jgi:glycosyltransferase involved in cell wall biosynthesis|nr:glycosyltransferase family 4 protein [Candidatus Paceibacterota bacterium]